MLVVSQITWGLRVLFFIQQNLSLFFVLFEFSMIPVLFLVCAYGEQTERVEGGYFIFIFTVFARVPLTVALFFSDFLDLEFIKAAVSEFQMFICSLSFLIKMPC